MAGGNELSLGRRIDAIETGRHDRRGADSQMDLFGTGITDHFDDLAARRPPNQRVIDHDDPLPLQHFRYRVELHLHAEVPDRLFRLDERPSDIMIAEQTGLKRDSRPPRVTQRCWNT